MSNLRAESKVLEQKYVSVLDQKAKGKSVWGYGASTRGNTLLHWLGFDHTIIDKIADRNPLKHGKFTAGGSIPITSEEEMRAAQPDNLLVLPYHFKQEFWRVKKKPDQPVRRPLHYS
jgi:NDP-4-keto-2,6-dideoxyhexose 3-C-methyltransferase